MPQRSNLLAVFLAVLGLVPCLGSAAQQIPVHQFGQSDGLANLAVNSLLADNTGFLWIGTENGLYRYDGQQFDRIGHPDSVDDVMDIFEDPSGRHWIGTQQGLFLVEGTTLRELLYHGSSVPVLFHESLAWAKGELLVVSEGRLLSFERDDAGSWQGREYGERHLAVAGVRGPFSSVRIDAEGSLWAGCGSRVCQFDHRGVHFWGRESGIPEDTWESIFPDRSGGLWLRGPDHLVYRSQGSRRFVDRTFGNPLFTDSHFPLFAEDPQGRIVTAAGNSVLRWRGNGWEVFGPNHGLSITVTTGITFDGDGQPWVGSWGQGLFKWLGYGQTENWTVADGLSSALVWSVVRDHRGRLWAATENGLDYLDRNVRGGQPRFVQVWSRLGIKSPHIPYLSLGKDGKLWLQTSNYELAWVDPDTLSVAYYQLPGRGFELFPREDGSIWIPTASGLLSAKKNADGIRVEKVADPTPSSGPILHLSEAADGKVWGATRSCLLRLDVDHWQAIDHGPAALSARPDMVTGSDGLVWLDGTFPGIERLQVVGDRVVSAKQIGPPDLASNEIVVLARDARGWIWIGGDNGLDVVNSNGNHWTRLTQEDGLVWNDIDNRGYFNDTDGTIWIATSGGITHVIAPEKIFAHRAPRARILSAEMGTHSLDLYGPTRLEWSAAPLTIRFTSLDFLHARAVGYRYRLSGQDSDWVTTTSEEIRYPHLSPGQYRFEMQSFDSEDHQQSRIARIEFLIAPPWWQSWPFYLLCSVLAVLAGYAVWRWRMRFLLRRQRELEELVEVRTSELRRQATHDGLTGLWNRGAMMDILAAELNRAARGSTALTVVMLDFDYFKAINDQHGHLAGDHVLREAARRFTWALRPYDSIGRYGGEEFLIVLPGCKGEECLERVESLRHRIADEPFVNEDFNLEVTCSFGVVSYCGEPTTIEYLLSCADEALYQAKKNGRNRIEYFGTVLDCDPVSL